MQLSVQQTQELLKIIDRNQLLIVTSELGSDYLTDYDKQLLRTYGIDPEAIYSPENSAITTSFHFGTLSEALGAFEASTITYKQIQQYVKEGKYLPVPETRKQALASIKMQSFSSLKTLNGNIFSDVNNILINKTREGQQEFIAERLKEGIEKRKTVSQIAHDIAEKTGDWNRNFDRIIETASQNAFEQGKAAEIQRRNEGQDPFVYKKVFENACKYCIKAYLTNGIGSQPKIFKLSELLANGSNIGRKVADYLPTIDPLHPYCRCPLKEFKTGYLWNAEKQSFSTPDPEYKKLIAQKRKLIPVMIGTKQYYL